ncbi:T9SS type A sorting domain-containing protein [Hymenobacter busanensis]|uniref:T9SS type A sorting domain-containing protein n=1 Tax=Hymenobacter busanensis TaxID=2607656 RepID=A0A7L4ZZS3_9BACT|nr:fibronectin type III domain-containing protein [Hymenobacter busanensis]KAA9331630.1 T9SS type A sorting domain-containing protein [Hymenobacter busanensis]QHJ08781.1 T9SS type A sorting domain-containing protein [Hymenobacter busanensis]
MMQKLRSRWRASNWRHAVVALVLSLTGLSTAHAQVDTYTFAASQGTYTPLTGGTVLPDILADTYLTPSIPLGFNFVFDGTVYTSVKAASDGYLTFSPTATSSSLTNNLATGTAANRPLVAPLWDDMDGRPTGATAQGSYLTSGTAPNRVFTFEWLNWEWRYNATGPVISFQVKLYEGTNRVEFIYRPESAPTNATATSGASIGLSGLGTGSGSFLSVSDAVAAPTVSSTVENNNIFVKPAAGQIYAFTPSAAATCNPVRNLAATSASSTTAQAAFVTNASATSYTVTYTAAGGTAQTVTPAPTTSPVNLTGLTPNTVYTISVTANCAGGQTSTAVTTTVTTMALPPSNDDCSAAVVVPVTADCASPVAGTVASATQSVAPTASCGITTLTSAADVWYRFIATSTAHNIVVGGQFAGVVDIRSGNCTTSTSLACNTFTATTARTQRVAGLTIGSTYYVRVYPNTTTAPTTGTFTVCVNVAPNGPANDDCATAQVLQVSNSATCSTRTVFNLTAATASSGAPAPTCANYQGGDIWFQVTVPTAPGTMIFETDSETGSAITDTGMEIYSGACANLTSIECDDDDSANGNFSYIERNNLTPGSTVYVRVWKYNDAAPTGTAAICVRFIAAPPAPANDNCAGAIALPLTTTCTTPLNGTVASATQSIAPTANCGSTTVTSALDVWYSFTATAAAHNVVIDGQFAGILDVRSGNCNTSTSVFCGTFTTGGARTLRVAGLTAGDTYYARVYPNTATAPSIGTSAFTICLNPAPVSTGFDECSAAQVLQVSNGSACTTRTVFTTAGATGSAGAPAPTCANYQGGDVWFQVTVPANGALTFETDGVTGSPITDTGMEIYSGTCGNLVSIECDDDDSANGLFSYIDRTGLTPGSTIYVRVWEYGNDAAGDLAICVRSVTPPPIPANDNCANAVSVTPSQNCTAPVSGYITFATPSQPLTTSCGTVTTANDVWYKFTATTTSHDVVVTPQFSSAVVQVFSGACATLTSIACNTYTSGNTNGLNASGLTVGDTYYVRVYPNTTATIPVAQGGFTICVKVGAGACIVPTAPAANAITATGATLTWAGTLGAGETYNVEYGQGNITAGGTGNTLVTGLTASSLTLTGLLSNTNYCFFVYKNCGTTIGTSQASVQACFRTNAAPALNDEPCAANPLTLGTVVQSNNTGATATTVGGIPAQLPACSPANAPRDVWYTVTVPAGATGLSLTLTGAATGMVRLYTAATCSTGFQQVGCRAAATNQSVGTVSFAGLTAGTTYYVAVSGFGNADTQGAFTISSAVLAARHELAVGSVDVFPNPTSTGRLTVRISGAVNTARKAQATLTNTLGQVVRVEALSLTNGAGEQQLSTTGLARGLYTLRLQVGQEMVTRQVAVE